MTTEIVDFLKACIDDGNISSETAERMHNIVELLRTKPTVALGPDGMVGATWQDTIDHINIEVFEDGTIEVFHEKIG